jgi:hypothetical protein
MRLEQAIKTMFLLASSIVDLQQLFGTFTSRGPLPKRDCFTSRIRMAIVVYEVTTRIPGVSQVFVGDQRLQPLGYCQGALVQVTDPNNAKNDPWIYTVPNREIGSLACPDPPPPAWIQAGVKIKIEVTPPEKIKWITPVKNEIAQSLPTPVLPASERLSSHVVYAVDVGSPNNGLAWARFRWTGDNTRDTRPVGSMNFSDFLTCLVNDLKRKVPVSLGFEAPLFLPVTEDVKNLSDARENEPAAWSASAGAYSATLAIPVISYVLRHIRKNVHPAPPVTLDSADWNPNGVARQQLHLWEAFVSGSAHAREENAHALATHVRDAATAVLAFIQWEAMDPRPSSQITASKPFSTVGAAVLWSELSNDMSLLHKEVSVLRPQEALGECVQLYVPSPGV